MNSIFKSLTSTRRLMFSSVIIIFIGSLLPSLPIVHYADAPSTTYLNHLFNVVLIVCVAGLPVVPVAGVYNRLGQVIAMCLMQIGELGLVTLIAISTYLSRRRMDLSEQSLLQSVLGYGNNNDLRHYLFHVYKITFIIESLVTIVLLFDFIPRSDLWHGIFNAIFLAVSAFCNAGFDNFGDASPKQFVLSPLVNVAVAAAIISDGIGFAVWMDLKKAIKHSIKDKPYRSSAFSRPLSNQTCLVLTTTGILLLLGTVLTWLIEFKNAKTIGHYAIFRRIIVCFSQSVIMRTTGLATISYLDTRSATNILYMIQMIIGGAPGGTVGGVKVATIAIAFLLLKSEPVGQNEVTFRYCVIANKVIKQTLTVLIFFLTILIIGYLLLLEFEPSHNPLVLLFEAISAIAAVSVSMDLTPKLSQAGRFVIMALMFIGRVGPITALLSLLQKKEKDIRYAQTNINVG